MGQKLYVGNLSYNVTEQQLSDTFSDCGTVESVKIITDRNTGRSKGFGFVEMVSDEEAQAVIDKFNETELYGRTLKINEARPKVPRENRGVFSGGGGGGGGRRNGGGGGGGGSRRNGDGNRW